MLPGFMNLCSVACVGWRMYAKGMVLLKRYDRDDSR